MVSCKHDNILRDGVLIPAVFAVQSRWSSLSGRRVFYAIDVINSFCLFLYFFLATPAFYFSVYKGNAVRTNPFRTWKFVGKHSLFGVHSCAFLPFIGILSEHRFFLALQSLVSHSDCPEAGRHDQWRRVGRMVFAVSSRHLRSSAVFLFFFFSVFSQLRGNTSNDFRGEFHLHTPLSTNSVRQNRAPTRIPGLFVAFRETIEDEQDHAASLIFL